MYEFIERIDIAENIVGRETVEKMVARIPHMLINVDRIKMYGTKHQKNTPELWDDLWSDDPLRSKEEKFKDRLVEALKQCEGAFTMLFLTEDKLIGVRDPYGFRPLCLGKKDGSFVLASETCSLDLIEAEFIREIEPGEKVIISKMYGAYRLLRQGIVSLL